MTVLISSALKRLTWTIEEIFLVANVSPEVVLDMPFLTLSAADIDSYTLNGVRV